MNPSNNSSPDESRVASRPLYRAGQTPPAPKPAPASAKTAITTPAAYKAKAAAVAKSGKPSLFKRVRLGLLVLLGLLGLGGLAYCIFAPDPVEEAKQDLAALRNDKNMSRKERGEKMGQIFGSLNEKQKNELFKEGREREKQRIKEFFELPKDKQIAKLKEDVKKSLEREKKWRAMRQANAGNAARGGGGGGAGGRGNGGGGGGGGGGGPGMGGRGGGGPGGPGGGFGGRGGGGFGGRGGDRNLAQKNRLDSMDPESRAQSSLYRSMYSQMRQQMGGGVGRGPGGGGRPPGR